MGESDMDHDREHDGDLARRLQEGDESAARALMERFGPELYGFALRMLEDPHVAEDVLQETLLAVLRSIGDYEPTRSLRAWIFGIHRHKVVDGMRKRSRRYLSLSDDPEGNRFRDDGHWAQGVRFPVWDEHAETLDVVRRCIEVLPHNQREAVLLRSFEGLSSTEAAQVLEIPEMSLRQLMHRARQSLRRCVEGKMGGLE